MDYRNFRNRVVIKYITLLDIICILIFSLSNVFIAYILNNLEYAAYTVISIGFFFAYNILSIPGFTHFTLTSVVLRFTMIFLVLLT